MKGYIYILMNGSTIHLISNNLETCQHKLIDTMMDYTDHFKVAKLDDSFSNYVIQEFLEGVVLVRNIYFLKFSFTDGNKEINTNFYLQQKISKLKTKLAIDETIPINTQNDLDIFIPLNITQTIENNMVNTEFITKLEKENKNVDIEFLRKRIEELTSIKDQEAKKLDDYKNTLDEKKQHIHKEKIETKSKKYKLKYEKEKWEELKRKFQVSLNLYKSFKKEMEEGTRNDIPELFLQEYNMLRHKITWNNLTLNII
jgi:hypothetical protein